MIDFNELNRRGAQHIADPSKVSHVWVSQPVWQGLLMLSQVEGDTPMVSLPRHEVAQVSSMVAGMAHQLDQTEVERDQARAEMAVMEEAIADATGWADEFKRRVRRITIGAAAIAAWASAIFIAHIIH